MRMTYLFFCNLLLGFIVQGQEQPELFEPGLVTKGGVFGLTISPDSKIALWVNSGGKRDTLKIMESVKRNGRWSTPRVASFSTSNGGWKDIDPMFTPDGNMVLFQSDRKVPSAPGREGFDIWAVKRTKNGWTEPFHLGNVINTDESESFASMSENGNIYFMKDNENEPGNSDIYMSAFVNGEYTTPVNLSTPVNTKHRESNPYISPAEDYLIYFSSDPAGFGQVDLYISFRKNNTWTQPKNLGPPVNTEIGEFCPFVHQKEKRLYFSRNRKVEGGVVEDLYYIGFDPDQYRDKF